MMQPLRLEILLTQLIEIAIKIQEDDWTSVEIVMTFSTRRFYDLSGTYEKDLFSFVWN